jgi:hypothetical protein
LQFEQAAYRDGALRKKHKRLAAVVGISVIMRLEYWPPGQPDNPLAGRFAVPQRLPE